MINFELFSEKSKILINDSQNKAIENNHQQVTPEHLVYILFDQNDEYVKNILNDLNVDISKIRKDLEDIIQSFPTILGNNINIYFSSEMVQAFLKSKDLIKEFNDRYISPEILLYSILFQFILFCSCCLIHLIIIVFDVRCIVHLFYFNQLFDLFHKSYKHGGPVFCSGSAIKPLPT